MTLSREAIAEGLRGIVGVLHMIDATEDLRQINRFDGDAGSLKDALGVANRVEGGRTRANGADAQVLQSPDNAANRGKPFEIGFELG